MRACALLLVIGASAAIAVLACDPGTGTATQAAATKDEGGVDRAEECVTCHMPEYRATKHPPHAGAKPTACGVCHTQDAWSPSVLVHEWPLTGAHVKTDCFACHGGTPTVFAGTPRACVGCHRADFDRSDFPGHADFPTTCADCHTTTKWKPATKPTQHPTPTSTSTATPTSAATATPTHSGTTPRAPTSPPVSRTPVQAHPESAFPIKSGNHAGIDCQQCHSLGGTNSKANTSCVHCHARSKYDGIHARVRNYPQGAAAPNFCVDCHSHGTRSRN